MGWHFITEGHEETYKMKANLREETLCTLQGTGRIATETLLEGLASEGISGSQDKANAGRGTELRSSMATM